MFAPPICMRSRRNTSRTELILRPDRFVGSDEDGVVIGFDGSVSSGRETIATEMSSIFADHETGRYAVKVQAVRTLGPQAVILRAIAGLVPRGQTAINPETNSHQTVVAEEHDGEWQIRLFQNTPAQLHGRPGLVEDMTRELQAVADAST
jgi:uncharacterized protein (TIGR02246 family)